MNPWLSLPESLAIVEARNIGVMINRFEQDWAAGKWRWEVSTRLDGCRIETRGESLEEALHACLKVHGLLPQTTETEN